MRMVFRLLVLLLVVGAGQFGSAAGNNSGRPSSDIVVITNWGSDTISLLNVKTAQHLGQIAVGPKPYDVKVDPTGKFAYVAASGSNFLSKVDLIAKLEQKDKRIVVGNSPRDIALNRDGTRAVVANSGSDDVSVVDLTAGRELYRVRNVGAAPYGVALTNDDRQAIVTLYASNKVAIINLGETSGEVTKLIDVPSAPYTVATTPSGKFAYATCFNEGVVAVIDLKSGTALTPIKVGRSPWGLGVSLDGKVAVVANFNSQDISILDIDEQGVDAAKGVPAPVKERTKISVARPLLADRVGAPTVLAKAKNSVLGSDPSLLVLTDLASNEVMLVNLATGKVSARIKVGQAPYGVDFIPKR
jgi:YVTN family beta-propeller protein